MHDLKSCGLVAPYGSRMSNVSRLPLHRRVLDSDIRRFEYFDRQWMRFIFTDCLEEPRKKRGTDDLIFERFGVGQFDYLRGIIFPVHPCEILIVGALDRLYSVRFTQRGWS